MSIALVTPTWVENLWQQKSVQQSAWLAAQQTQAYAAFQRRGLPLRREEYWKYTDVGFLQSADFVATEAITKINALPVLPGSETSRLVILNGQYAANLSDVSGLPDGVIVTNIETALSSHADLVQAELSNTNDIKRFPFASLNLALLQTGAFIYVPKGTIVKPVIHILVIGGMQKQAAVNLRHLIIAGENADVSVCEEYRSVAAENDFTNVVTQIHAQENARVHCYKIQHEKIGSTHIAHTLIQQQKQSYVKTVNLSVGSRLTREDIQVNLDEDGSECDINGYFALSHDTQHADHHIQIDHRARHTTSDMTYKGVLDKKTHGVFNGMVYVHPDAQKTRSHQANHNLLLSKEAAIDTKPELEIYADDVKCAHGDTVGQLNLESLFFLRARGIDKAEALKMLTEAFAADVLDKVEHESVLLRMKQVLSEARL